jgi:glycosyltransferase involved in cell wall biosynthesis
MASLGKGAVLYDHLLVDGGAEQVTLALAACLQADVVCDFIEPQHFSAQALAGLNVTPLGRPLHSPVLRLLQEMRHFRRRSAFLAGYDWVLYSGSAAPLAVDSHCQGANVYYCHTLPRFAYDLQDFYLAALPRWQRPLLLALAAYVRPRYERALQRMDLLLANSRNVQARIKKYLGRDAVVLHPPCDTLGYRWLGQQDYFLSTARLEPYKRVEVIIRAFCAMPERRLLVASGGSDEARLKRLGAGAPNIEFVGWCDAMRLRQLVGRALATLYIPRDEDFGISPVESMAAGKPVIGVAEGGLLETVRDGETGLLIASEPDPGAVIAAVRSLTPERARSMRWACEQRARLFGQERFFDGIKERLLDLKAGQGRR